MAEKAPGSSDEGRLPRQLPRHLSPNSPTASEGIIPVEDDRQGRLFGRGLASSNPTAGTGAAMGGFDRLRQARGRQSRRGLTGQGGGVDPQGWGPFSQPSSNGEKRRSMSLPPPASPVAGGARVQRGSSLPAPKRPSIDEFIFRSSVSWEDLPGDVLRHVCSYLSCIGDLLAIFGTCRLWQVHITSLRCGVAQGFSYAPPVLFCENGYPTGTIRCAVWDPASGGKKRLLTSYEAALGQDKKIIGVCQGYKLAVSGRVCYVINLLTDRVVRTMRLPVSHPQIVCFQPRCPIRIAALS